MHNKVIKSISQIMNNTETDELIDWLVYEQGPNGLAFPY